MAQVRVTVPMAGLPQCLSGYKLAMLSDVHGGPLVGLTDVGQFVDQLNALGADAELLVGDLADGPPSQRGARLLSYRCSCSVRIVRIDERPAVGVLVHR